VCEELIESKRKGRLVVFAGAGVSCVAPTSLPTWSGLQNSVLDAVANTARPVCGDSLITACKQLIQARQSKAPSLPPEYVAEIMANRFPKEYFRVLQCLDSETPNEVHLVLATLAKTGSVCAIVTTNFDRAIEVAFRDLDVPLDVRFTEEHFLDLSRNLDAVGRKDFPCQLLKLHGTAQDSSTLIDTLAQRRRGFSAAKASCVRRLLRTGHWLFMGFSGLDLAADSNYLFLRSESEHAHGFTWLIREGSEPFPATQALADLYGDRARFAFGNLPEWIRPLLEELPAPPLPDTEDRTGHAHIINVAAHTGAWAAERGAVWCAVVLSDILKACGHPQKALELLGRCENAVAGSVVPSGAFGALCDSIGSLMMSRGQYEKAKQYYERAIENAGEQDVWLSVALHNMAILDATLGDIKKALETYDAALHICEIHNDVYGRAATLMAIGNLHFSHTGDVELAFGKIHEALTIYETAGDDHGRATALNNLSQLYVATGNSEKAMALLDESMNIRERLGDAPGVASTMDNEAHVLTLMHRYDDSLSLLLRANDIRRNLDDAPGMARTMANIGVVFQQKGNHKAAMDSFSESFEIVERIGGELSMKAGLVLNMGTTNINLGKFSEALDQLHEARTIYEDLGNRRGLARVVSHTAGVYAALGRLKDAEHSYKEALKLWQEAGDSSGEAETRLNLGIFYLQSSGRPSKAVSHLEIAVEIFRRLRSPLAEQAESAIADCLDKLRHN
jgi:tetratricopeptide (TPR) repeat protein